MVTVMDPKRIVVFFERSVGTVGDAAMAMHLGAGACENAIDAPAHSNASVREPVPHSEGGQWASS